jgi:hypothetical protein
MIVVRGDSQQLAGGGSMSFRLGVLVIGAVGWIACGGPEAGSGQRGLPSDYLNELCSSTSDCDDGNPCTIDSCSKSTRTCEHLEKRCPTDEQCRAGVCNTDNGQCELKPTKEGEACMNKDGPGVCTSGNCAAVPQCELYSTYADDCSWYERSVDTTSSLYASQVLSDYACATGETGPEVAFLFAPNKEGPVTVSLSATTADFDLIVLEGTYCVASAACKAFATTAGVGNESVTFDAKVGESYVIVVEGRAGAKGSFNLNVDCPKTCDTPGTKLACNQTVMGNTTGKTNKFDSTSVCTGASAGPEDAYYIEETTSKEYRLKLSGMSQDHDLFVVSSTSDRDCDGYCSYKSVQTGTMTESLTFTAYSSSRYYVVVDSKSTPGPYQLEVYCPPNCYNSLNKLSCTFRGDARRNDDARRSTRIVDSYGSCATNQTGYEVSYSFMPTTSGQYTVALTGATADLDLIVMESTSSSRCDPTAACTASATTVGTGNESVTFTASSSKYYYIIVDGKNGAASGYQIKLSGSACGAPTCRDAYETLSCTTTTKNYNNDDPTYGSNDVDSWGTATNLTGPEVAHRFSPTVTKSYTFTLSNMTADLDLIAIEIPSGSSCSPTATVVATSTNSGTQTESVTFTATSGKTYFLIVDGKNGATSDYTIALTNGC